MPQALVQGFITVDAGQAGGVIDISDRTMLEGELYNNVKTRIPFGPLGAQRETMIAGKIEADTSTIVHYVPTDTSDATYNDFILSWDDNPQPDVTIVFRPDPGAKATTNPEVTIVGHILDDPTHFEDNTLIESRFALEITSVTFDNVTTVITT